MSSVVVRLLDSDYNYVEIYLPFRQSVDDELYDAFGDDYENYEIEVVEVSVDGIDYSFWKEFLGVTNTSMLDKLNEIVERIESIDDNDLINAVIEISDEEEVIDDILDEIERGRYGLSGDESLQDYVNYMIPFDGLFDRDILIDCIDFYELERELNDYGYYNTSYGFLYSKY